MEFKQIISRRRSTRKFLSTPVEREKLQRIIDAALVAPTSRNTRSTRFYVVEESRPPTSGSTTAPSPPPPSSSPSSTRAWLRAGCTSTPAPALRMSPRVLWPTTTSVRSWVFPLTMVSVVPWHLVTLIMSPSHCLPMRARSVYTGSKNRLTRLFWHLSRPRVAHIHFSMLRTFGLRAA